MRERRVNEVLDSQRSTDGTDSRTEALVYLVISPKSGPNHRIYCEDDIQAFGGVHAIERAFEKECYWFVRLGQIRGELGAHGLTFQDSAFAALPMPPESEWRTGRLNPAFGRSELERIVFRSVFRAIERMLDGWKWVEDGTVNAYALKELRVSSKRLTELTNALHSLGQVHDVARITVIKHWYDPSWSEPHIPNEDVVLAEYMLTVPFQVRWSAGNGLLAAEVMPVARC